MNNNTKLQKIAVAASAFLALGSYHLNALSDSGTLTIKGSVTATTCTVNFGGGGAGGTTGNTTLQLPSVTPTELATGTAATPVFLTGTTKFTIVTLTNTGGGTACTSVDTPNLTLDTIKLSDIQNLAAGVAVNSGQKTFEITVTCQKNALSSNQTFVPQFSPRKSAVLTGNSHVALNDGTDNGVGFKLFDFSGSVLPFNTPLSNFPNSQFDMSPAFLPVTWPYTIKYAKTSKAVISGTVTSSIMITFSVL